MKLMCSVLLLAILEESYCKTKSTVNRTSTSWGYSYSLSDTRGFKVKHDDKGYQFEPFYNDTSSGLKKHYSSKSVYDQFTSPGATTDRQSHRSTNDFINGTTNSRSYGTILSLEGDKVTNKIRFDKLANGVTTTVPASRSHRVPVTETRTEAPIATNKASYGTPKLSHSINVGSIHKSPRISSNGPLHKTTFGAPYGSQYTTMSAAPTGSLYYPQAPSYGQMYGPAGSSMYGVRNGQIYGPPKDPMYGPPKDPMYGPPTGNLYVPTGPDYGMPSHSISGYAPQNGQMYGLPRGQTYIPQNGQTKGYPTGSLYGSNRNF